MALCSCMCLCRTCACSLGIIIYLQRPFWYLLFERLYLLALLHSLGILPHSYSLIPLHPHVVYVAVLQTRVCICIYIVVDVYILFLYSPLQLWGIFIWIYYGVCMFCMYVSSSSAYL